MSKSRDEFCQKLLCKPFPNQEDSLEPNNLSQLINTNNHKSTNQPFMLRLKRY